MPNGARHGGTTHNGINAQPGISVPRQQQQQQQPQTPNAATRKPSGMAANRLGLASPPPNGVDDPPPQIYQQQPATMTTTTMTTRNVVKNHQGNKNTTPLHAQAQSPATSHGQQMATTPVQGRNNTMRSETQQQPPPPAVQPPVGFYPAGLATLIQESESTLPPPNAPTFNPHAESPSIRKTSGIDHSRSGPINREVIVAGVHHGGGGGGGGSMLPRTTTTNFTNPQLDTTRRIGMPGGSSPSPMQNRAPYRPPGPAIINTAAATTTTNTMTTTAVKRGFDNHTSSVYVFPPPFFFLPTMVFHSASLEIGEGKLMRCCWRVNRQSLARTPLHDLPVNTATVDGPSDPKRSRINGGGGGGGGGG